MKAIHQPEERNGQQRVKIKLLKDNYEQEQKEKERKENSFLRRALNINDLNSSAKKEKPTEQINKKKYPTLCACVSAVCLRENILPSKTETNKTTQKVGPENKKLSLS